MGAINTARLSARFPTDKIGDNARRIDRMFATMLARGNPFPDTPANLSIAQMKDHVAAAVGQAIADEIANDPAARGYAGKTDAEQAQLINDRQVIDRGFRGGTVLLRRTVVNGNTLTCQAENGAPLTLSQYVGKQGLSIIFYEQTPTVALRGARVPSTGNITDVTIELNAIPPAMTDNDLFRVVIREGQRIPARHGVVLRGIPFAPADAITAQDVADAKA